jgi:hypothetical protein
MFFFPYNTLRIKGDGIALMVEHPPFGAGGRRFESWDLLMFF